MPCGSATVVPRKSDIDFALLVSVTTTYPFRGVWAGVAITSGRNLGSACFIQANSKPWHRPNCKCPSVNSRCISRALLSKASWYREPVCDSTTDTKGPRRGQMKAIFRFGTSWAIFRCEPVWVRPRSSSKQTAPRKLSRSETVSQVASAWRSVSNSTLKEFRIVRPMRRAPRRERPKL